MREEILENDAQSNENDHIANGGKIWKMAHVTCDGWDDENGENYDHPNANVQRSSSRLYVVCDENNVNTAETKL